MILLHRWRSVALHAWRERPGLLMVLYLVLSVLAAPGRTDPAHGLITNPQAAILPLAFFAFLAWRVSAGGWISRGWLILIAVKGYTDTAVSLARLWQPMQLWLLAVFAAQVALLVSPAVHHRTRPVGKTGQPAGPTPLTGTPRWWMIPAGLLTGLALTLLLLRDTGWAAIPGCGHAGASAAGLPGRCTTLARGAPLRFLYGYQGLPQIDIAALIKDWAQWSLISLSAICVLRLVLYGRKPAASLPGLAADQLPTAPGSGDPTPAPATHTAQPIAESVRPPRPS